jgi:hypothetical protein
MSPQNCPDLYSEGEICLITGTYALKRRMDLLCRTTNYTRCKRRACNLENEAKQTDLAIQDMLANANAADERRLFFAGDEPVDFGEPDEKYSASLDAATRSDDMLLRVPNPRAQRSPKCRQEFPNPITSGRSFDGSEARKGYRFVL